jgi:hypothetical protein
MLATLISDRWKESASDKNETVLIDSRGHSVVSDTEPIFIDRNGLLFQYVLDYLREGEVYLPSTVSRAAVLKEFDFYGIDADTSKLVEKYGVDYYHSIREKAEALDNELRAIRIASEAESKFWKSASRHSSVSVTLSDDDRSHMNEDLETLLRARLFERGLKLDSQVTYFVNVSRAISRGK